MQNVLVNKAHALKAQTRAALEAELGRALSDEEEVTIMVFPLHPAPRGRARRDTARKLKAHLKRVDRRARKMSRRVKEAALQEALQSARPGYRERA